ncbi:MULTISPECIES: FecCD family ABC transporter permease [Streptomyces]|uniref:Iron ABC transporter permease n=1 Tax=Streptomyces doudnae TaxID=3075536 RepID=A0ABD5ETY2_9ACTN|nr:MULTISPECIES: iron ABC transporter permease [unclassified Streptomyces]MDT0438176.1 iron ABC transporter permease [Streptomyces sp. DSM 41981]MYQ67725.1 iron chelate uptake ABC transporter family permease subunit [Streptomyces sp. SID4950]SCE39212.1 iron complex transport system permease protein [Streptomyces sp. SolWspMP-5a-2]
MPRTPADRRAPSRGPHPVPGRATGLLYTALAAMLVAAVTVAVSTGTVAVPARDVWDVVLRHLTGGADRLDPLQDQIVWDLRLPRVLVAAVVGAGLGVIGVALQALVRNPLADPYMLGITPGASLGAVLVSATGSTALSGLGMTGGAFVASVLTMGAVFVIAQRGGRLTDTRLILAGVAVGYLAVAATSFVQLQTDPQRIAGIMFWLMGSLAGAEWSDLRLPTAALVLGTLWLFTQGRSLNALMAGDDTAAGLGVDVHRLRRRLLVVTSLMTATVVVVAGGLGFVGLVIPHIARLAVGAEHRRVLPTSLLTGAVFLVLVDLAGRTVARPDELPVGIFTAAVGVPVLLWLLRRARRSEGM